MALKSKSFISVLNKGCCAENGGFGLLLIEWVFEDRGRGAFFDYHGDTYQDQDNFFDHEILLMIAITF